MHPESSPSLGGYVLNALKEKMLLYFYFLFFLDW